MLRDEMVHRSADRDPRLLCLAVACLSFVLVDCLPPTRPPPSSPPQQPPPQQNDRVDDAPRSPMLFVSTIRSVDTPRVPRTLVEDLSRRLSDRIGTSGMFSLAPTTTSTTPCLLESCELNAARQAAAKSVLHTRLVQYADSCVLLAVLYDTQSQRNEWAFARTFPCDASNLESEISQMVAGFLSRPQSPPQGPVYAVVPIQHEINDIVWASESFAEYLTTLLAENGKTVVPASSVAAFVPRKEHYRGCPDKWCAVDLADSASAQRSVMAKITKRTKTSCTITAALYDVATKTSSVTASAQSGCEAASLAEGFKSIADTLSGGGTP